MSEVNFPGVLAAVSGRRERTQEELDELAAAQKARHAANRAWRSLQDRLYAVAQRTGFRALMYKQSGKYSLSDPMTNKSVLINGRYYFTAEELLDHCLKMPRVKLCNRDMRKKIQLAAERAKYGIATHSVLSRLYHTAKSVGLRFNKNKYTGKFVISNPTMGDVCLKADTAEEAFEYLQKQPKVMPSLSQSKPWVAEGIGRRQWERRRYVAKSDAPAAREIS